MIRKRYFSDISIFLEKTFLLSYDSKSKLINNIFCCICVVLGCLVNASLYFSDFKKSLNGSLFFCVLGTIIIIQLLFIQCNQKKIKSLLHILNALKKMHTIKWEKDLFESDSKPIWAFIYKYYNIVRTYMFFYFLVPFFVDFLVGNIKPDFISLRVPIPGQPFIDLVKPRSLSDFFASLVSFIYCLVVSHVYFGIEGFVLIAITYTRAELKLLNKKILIVKDTLQKNHEYHDKKLFVIIIKHHQSILVALKNLNRTIGFLVAIKNTTISICLCLNLYTVTTQLNLADYGSIIQSAFSIITVNALLLTSCGIGESLEAVNGEVLYNVYDLPWYLLKPEQRKTLNMMIRQAKKPFVINYHRRSNLNLHGYMQVINASYSYFMMLKSTVR